MRNGRKLAKLGTAGAVAMALAASGCGSSDSGSSSDSSSMGSADTQAQLDKLYKGTFGTPPASAPKPQAGKEVWLISCGQALISCSAPIASAEEAAKQAGWKTRVVDGKFDPSQYANGVRQALAANADGIITFAIDCAAIEQPLAEAEKAKVPTVSMESINCPSGGYSSVVDYQEGDFKTWETQWGATKAVYIANKTGGKAKVIDFYDDETQASALIDKGFLAELKKCSGCKVVDRVSFTAADLGPKLQQKAEQALLKNPDANAIQIPFDAATLTGIGAAIKASGRGKEIVTVGGEGYEPAADLVRQGIEQKAGSGSAGGWEGWASIDTMNRLLNGEKAAPSGIGLQLFDAEHNLGKTGGWEPPVDYKADYPKACVITP